MSKKKKVYTPGFRAKVALAAVRGDRTVQQLAGDFEVSPQVVSHWKSRLVTGVEELFHDNRARKKEEATDEAALFEQIGRLKMQLEFYKKKFDADT